MQIRVHQRNLTPELIEHVERRLRFSLARLSSRVRTATLRLQDLDGSCGGARCLLEIRTAWNSKVEIHEWDADVCAAVSRAAERAGRTVERQAGIHCGDAVWRRSQGQIGD